MAEQVTGEKKERTIQTNSSGCRWSPCCSDLSIAFVSVGINLVILMIFRGKGKPPENYFICQI